MSNPKYSKLTVLHHAVRLAALAYLIASVKTYPRTILSTPGYLRLPPLLQTGTQSSHNPPRSGIFLTEVTYLDNRGCCATRKTICSSASMPGTAIDDLEESNSGVEKHQVSYQNIGDARAHVHP